VEPPAEAGGSKDAIMDDITGLQKGRVNNGSTFFIDFFNRIIINKWLKKCVDKKMQNY